jgi:hypothetical protein
VPGMCTTPKLLKRASDSVLAYAGVPRPRPGPDAGRSSRLAGPFRGVGRHCGSWQTSRSSFITANCQTMPFSNSLSSATMIAGGLLAALTGVQPAPAIADVWYPWCLHGETSQCYYTSREQCEQSADYRGICYPNPLSQPNRARPLR